MKHHKAGIALLYGCLIVFIVWAAYLMVTTVPSERAQQRWESDYVSILPTGYTDFVATKQSQDVGIRIFSFRCPEKMAVPEILDHLTKRRASYQIYDHTTNRVAMKRPTNDMDRNGFDEFRFHYRENGHCVFGLFANLDTEWTVV